MKKKLLSLLAILFSCLFPCLALAASLTPTQPQDENTIVKEYEFTTTEKPFVYTLAPKSIREKNREYFLQSDTKYELISENPLYKDETKEFIRTRSKQGLSSEDESIFPDSVEIDDDGFTGTLQRSGVAFKSRNIDGGSKTHVKSIKYGYLVDPPTPLEQAEITVKGQKLSLLFVDLKDSGTHWQKNHIAKYTLHSDTQTYDLGGQSILMNSEKPQLKGMEHDLLSAMKLDAGTHVIDKITWNDALSYNGQTYSRTLKVTLKRLVSMYTANYSLTVDNPDTILYDATATYKGMLTKKVEDGTEYYVKAITTYYSEPVATPTPNPTPTPTPTPEPEIPMEEPQKKSGIGGIIAFVVVLAVVGGAAYFALQWKKKRDSQM